MWGELVVVWSEAWRAAWLPLIDREAPVREATFCELYRETAKALKEQPTCGELAEWLRVRNGAKRPSGRQGQRPLSVSARL